MNVNPWLPADDLIDPLVDIVLSAEREGLDVLLPKLEQGYDEGLSALDETAAAVALVLTTKAIRKAWRDTAATASGLASDFWLAEAAREGIASRVRNLRPPARLLEGWMDPGIDLHVRLRDNVAEETRLSIESAIAAGTSPEVLVRDFQENGLPSTNGRMGGRARVIAADQLFGLAALIAAFQQKDAGISHFIWRTRSDGRVREAHRDLQGERFAWSNPPNEGLPGEPIACRCWAEGVVES